MPSRPSLVWVIKIVSCYRILLNWKNGLKNLCGFNWWSFADFDLPLPWRYKPHVNQKAFLLIVKKNVSYSKSIWPWTCSVSRNGLLDWWNGIFEKLPGGFTNMDEVELFQNGKIIRKNKVVCFGLNLLEGENMHKPGIKGECEKEHGLKLRFSRRIKHTVCLLVQWCIRPICSWCNPDTFKVMVNALFN